MYQNKLTPGNVLKDILNCFKGKWTRRDIVAFIASYLPSFTEKQVLDIINSPNRMVLLKPILYTIADSLIWEINNHCLHVGPIRYTDRLDGNSGKIRRIGIQTIKHQLLDHIAVSLCWEIWHKRLQPYQCASIRNRGQVMGKNIIEMKIRKHPDKTRFCGKGDITKCYPSINRDLLKEKLANDIDNDLVLYLLFFLIDTFDKGLSIGSYLSQFLCNYFLSFAYTHLLRECAGFFSTLVFYMDDFLIMGGDKDLVVESMIEIIKYLKEDLDLTVKSNWEVFLVDQLEMRDGKVIRRGKPIDMMGFVMYRDHTVVRTGIFLRARKLYIRAYIKYAQFNKPIPLDMAYKCISYYGWFKNSDSAWFIREYNIKKIVNMSKTTISTYSKGGKR